MKKKKRKTTASASGAIGCACFGSLASIIILFALLVIFSALALIPKNPHPLLAPLSFFSLYSSAFFGGFLSVKKSKGRDSLLCGLLNGILTAILFSLLFGVVGFLTDAKGTPLSWLFRALIIPASILGALLGKRTKAKRKKRKKR